MCMIVDVNVAHKVLLSDNDPDFKDVHSCLFTSRMPNAKVVHGGKLTEEYNRSNAIRKMILQLDRAGRVLKVNDHSVNSAEVEITRSGVCRSDDAHIIALARVSNVRLLCSHDKNLIVDFTNSRLLSSPRGKVYKTSSHNELLDRSCR